MNPIKVINTMKYYIIFAFILLVMPSSAQESQFFKAMKTNDFSEVDSFLGNRLDLCIYENQDLYSKQEAIKRISAWIKQKQVNSISEVHRGQSADKNSKYRVAQLSTNDGIFRVFVYVSNEKGKQIIKKIQIDRF